MFPLVDTVSGTRTHAEIRLVHLLALPNETHPRPIPRGYTTDSSSHPAVSIFSFSQRALARASRSSIMSDRPRLGVATTEPPSGSPLSPQSGDCLVPERLSRVPTSTTASSTSGNARRDYTALDLALLSSPAKPSPTQPSIAGVPSADSSFPLSLDSQAWAERQGFLIMQLTSGANAASLQQIMPPGLSSPSMGPFAAGSGSGSSTAESKDAPAPSFDELEQEALAAALASFDVSLLESTHFMTSSTALSGGATASSAHGAAPAPAAVSMSSHAESSALAADVTSALRRSSLAPTCSSSAAGPDALAAAGSGASLPAPDAEVPEPAAGPDLKDEMRRNMAAIWLENERRRLKAATSLKRSKTSAKTVLTIMSPFSPRAQAPFFQQQQQQGVDVMSTPAHGHAHGFGHNGPSGSPFSPLSPAAAGAAGAGTGATAAAAAIDAAASDDDNAAGQQVGEPEAA